MGKTPRTSSTDVIKTFEKIGGSIEPHADPKLGSLLVRLVKNKDDLRLFAEAPKVALEKAGIKPASVNAEVLQRVAKSVAERIDQLRPGGIVMDTVSSKESSSNQDRNFDHSSSWFQNKDGYNVIYDAGHSSEKTTGELVGQDKKFSGIDIHDFGDVIRNDLNTLFFPAQPLVTPQLIDKIKAARKTIGQ